MYLGLWLCGSWEHLALHTGTSNYVKLEPLVQHTSRYGNFRHDTVLFYNNTVYLKKSCCYYIPSGIIHSRTYTQWLCTVICTTSPEHPAAEESYMYKQCRPKVSRISFIITYIMRSLVSSTIASQPANLC